MTKNRISTQIKSRLDLCGFCDEAWLDRGEWDLLKQLQLSRELPKVFTESWQRKIRQKISEEKRANRFLSQLGDSDFKEAERVRQWLENHPKKQEILQYLNYE